MQPKLLLPPIASHGLITVTISSWAHPVLSSNLSKKFKTLLQDSSSLHLVITTLHFSCKSCTSFPFQSALNTKLHTCASMLWTLPVLITSLNSYKSTLRLARFFLFQNHACSKSNNTNARLMALALSLTLNPVFGIHSHKTQGNAQLTSFKTNLKTFLFSQYFRSR